MIARGPRFPGSDNPVLLIALVLLVFYALQGGLIDPIRDYATDPIKFIGFIVAIVLGITVHEFMHAYVANRLGDDTGRVLGRMTLNPLAHFDVFGTLLILVARFGYGKPVPINEARLRGPAAITMVAVAGPLANIGLAAICALPLRFSASLGSGALASDYDRILVSIVLYNCLLAVFNLLPVPPLDGANVVFGLLPPRQQYAWRTYQQYGPMLLLLLLLVGFRFLNTLVGVPASFLINLLIGGGGRFF